VLLLEVEFGFVLPFDDERLPYSVTLLSEIPKPEIVSKALQGNFPSGKNSLRIATKRSPYRR
jgi:hypothetical protein